MTCKQLKFQATKKQRRIRADIALVYCTQHLAEVLTTHVNKDGGDYDESCRHVLVDQKMKSSRKKAHSHCLHNHGTFFSDKIQCEINKKGLQSSAASASTLYVYTHGAQNCSSTQFSQHVYSNWPAKLVQGNFMPMLQGPANWPFAFELNTNRIEHYDLNSNQISNRIGQIYRVTRFKTVRCSAGLLHNYVVLCYESCMLCL